MGSSMDAGGMPSSLTQRRPAASHLPNFELPPPSNLQFAAQHYGHKFPPLSGIVNSHSSHQALSLGNLPTPPPNSTPESNGNTHAHSMPVLPYTPSFWQGAGQNTTGYSSGLTPQSWQNGPVFASRSVFSPHPGSLARHDPNSPSTGGASVLPPPSYDVGGVPSYAHGVSLASPTSTQGAQSSIMGNPMLSNQVQQPHQRSPISPIDSISKASSAPGLYAAMTASATPQPPYGFQSSTPVTQSPHSSSAPASTISPPLSHGPIPQHHSQQSPFMKPPYPSYSLPAMPGPVLTNVNNPGSQMAMVGNLQAHMMPMHFNSGYAANPQLQYAQARANSPQQAVNQDRPFKCDECPQSFNRNHDLKRHKRIHLAVKPFPCQHCDKSFSRKDALKVCYHQPMPINHHANIFRSDISL